MCLECPLKIKKIPVFGISNNIMFDKLDNLTYNIIMRIVGFVPLFANDDIWIKCLILLELVDFYIRGDHEKGV